MNIQKTITLAAGLSAFAMAAQVETSLAIATSYQDSNFHTQNIRQFAADVEKATDGDISFTLHTGASLLKMPEIMCGV